jgi:AraC-like DNA-binding protein
MVAPMADLMFGSSPVVVTADVDEATDALCRVYAQAQINPIRSTRVNMRMNAAQFPTFGAGCLHFGADVSIQAEDVSAYYIDTPLCGEAVTRWWDGYSQKTGLGSAAVLSPGTPCEIGWSGDCDQIYLKVSEPQIRGQLEDLLNRSARKRVTFARLSPKTTASSDWVELIRILARESGRPDGVLAHRLAVDNLQRLLIQGLLLIQPHNYADALSEREPPASAAEVRRAIDLMDAQPETAWSTLQLARAIGVSSKALLTAFRRSDRPRPMEYLRRLRLDRTHAELAASPPEAVTVTTVAGRWGFVHLGWFAGQYRQQFGESPSETLSGAFCDDSTVPLACV